MSTIKKIKAHEIDVIDDLDIMKEFYVLCCYNSPVDYRTETCPSEQAALQTAKVFAENYDRIIVGRATAIAEVTL